jgi:GT2 family glycosyltransferase
MLLSIIIVNYDTRTLLMQCLDSIPASTPEFPFEIVVVNNGSRIDTCRSLQGLHPDATVIDLPVNVGFGQANNLAARKARGEYLLLLNSDTYFVDKGLAEFVSFVRANPNVDLFGCRVLNPDGSPQPCFRNCGPHLGARGVLKDLLERNPLMEKFRKSFPLPPDSGEPEEPYWLSGCCLCVKREVFEQSHGFDPDFFLYFEETEWFYSRLFGRGYTIGMCNDLSVVHIERGSQTSLSSNDQVELSRFLFYHKLGPSCLAAAFAMSFLNVFVRLLCLPLAPWYFKQNLSLIGSQIRCLGQAIREVPWYPRAYGSRPAPLMLAVHRAGYSWSRMSQSMLAEGASNNPRSGTHLSS